MPQPEHVQHANSSVTTDHRPSPAPSPPSPPPARSATTVSATYEPVAVLPREHDDNGHTHERSLYPQEHTIYPEVQCAAYSPYSLYPEEPAGPLSIPSSLLKPPFIHDPGSGPRVKDVRAFLDSRLASPPSLDDPLCGEFADEAILQMLCTVLPEETAMVRRDAFSPRHIYNSERRYCGTTRAGLLRGYAQRARGCIGSATSSPITLQTSRDGSLRMALHRLSSQRNKN